MTLELSTVIWGEGNRYQQRKQWHWRKRKLAPGTDILRGKQDTGNITVPCDRSVSGWDHRKQGKGQHQIPAGLQAGGNTQEKVRILWIAVDKPRVVTLNLHYKKHHPSFQVRNRLKRAKECPEWMTRPWLCYRRGKVVTNVSWMNDEAMTVVQAKEGGYLAEMYATGKMEREIQKMFRQ